jgi:L-alanine-DL-glutamate epimerase-like enolase superfamily enzyme
MPEIADARCILLSSPYADADDPEIKECFPNGPKRTVGMVEVTLDNGVTGLGEGYLAVFAPLVFKAIFDLCRPYVVGRDGFDIVRRVKDLCSVCDYWSLQGAARHVTSAFEIALVDAKAKSLGVPAWQMLGGAESERIRIYGSGGCCDAKDQFLRELDLLESLGIDLYKIRAVKDDVRRTAWVLNEAGRRGIEVGVDMCQNLADPPQSPDQVIAYLEAVRRLSDRPIAFLEEAIGPDCPEGFKALRARVDIPICGGEIITTPKEMIDRIDGDVYDFVQPDASVIGGIGAVLQVFRAVAAQGTDVVVHAWGGAAARIAGP